MFTPAAATTPRTRRPSGAAPVYSAAREPDGAALVMEDGREFNPVPAAVVGRFRQWQFDWGPASTAVGRDWLAWALHERLGLDRANLKHAAAFRRLVEYLGRLPGPRWTRSLDEFRAASRRPSGTVTTEALTPAANPRSAPQTAPQARRVMTPA